MPWILIRNKKSQIFILLFKQNSYLRQFCSAKSLRLAYRFLGQKTTIFTVLLKSLTSLLLVEWRKLPQRHAMQKEQKQRPVYTLISSQKTAEKQEGAFRSRYPRGGFRARFHTCEVTDWCGNTMCSHWAAQGTATPRSSAHPGQGELQPLNGPTTAARKTRPQPAGGNPVIHEWQMQDG